MAKLNLDLIFILGSEKKDFSLNLFICTLPVPSPTTHAQLHQYCATYYVPDAILGPGHTVVWGTNIISAFAGFHSSWER